MSESVVIALAGATKEELRNAKWAEIPRQDYINAAHFCTSHRLAYQDMTVNEASATKLFAEQGRTSDAVLQPAVPVLATEELKQKLDGPADTGTAGLDAHERIAAIDGSKVEECSDEEGGTADMHAALPDEEFPATALPAMQFCADSLTSGDMDEM